MRRHPADCGSAKRADLRGRELHPRHRKSVVAPSLTPEGYNPTPCGTAALTVVAPSLTPEGYNQARCGSGNRRVVAPSLTPEGYN